MQKIKLFIGLEGFTTDLEKEINQWLQEANARVVQICSNIAPQSISGSEKSTPLGGVGGQHMTRQPSDVLVTILYEEP